METVTQLVYCNKASKENKELFGLKCIILVPFMAAIELHRVNPPF